MYKYIVFATLIVSIPFQSICQLRDTETKLQAIITPIDMLYRDELNSLNQIPIRINRIQKRSNIKTKGIYITIWLKKNSQVKSFHKFSIVKKILYSVWMPCCIKVQLRF